MRNGRHLRWPFRCLRSKIGLMPPFLFRMTKPRNQSVGKTIDSTYHKKLGYLLSQYVCMFHQNNWMKNAIEPWNLWIGACSLSKSFAKSIWIVCISAMHSSAVSTPWVRCKRKIVYEMRRSYDCSENLTSASVKAEGSWRRSSWQGMTIFRAFNNRKCTRYVWSEWISEFYAKKLFSQKFTTLCTTLRSNGWWKLAKRLADQMLKIVWSVK